MFQRNRQNRRNTGILANKTKIFEQVADIFKNQIDDDVIRLILDQYDWKAEEAIEKLFQMASDGALTPVKRQDIDLAIIACSLLEMDDNPKDQVPAASPSASDVSPAPDITAAPESVSVAGATSCDAADSSIASTSSYSQQTALNVSVLSSTRNTSENSTVRQMSGGMTEFSSAHAGDAFFAENYDVYPFDPNAVAATEESIMQIYEEMFCEKTPDSTGTVKTPGDTDAVQEICDMHTLDLAPKPASLSESGSGSEQSFVVLIGEASFSATQSRDSKHQGSDQGDENGDTWSRSHTLNTRNNGITRDKPAPLILPSESNSTGQSSVHNNTACSIHMDRLQDIDSLDSISSSFEVIPDTSPSFTSVAISSSHTASAEKAIENCKSSFIANYVYGAIDRGTREDLHQTQTSDADSVDTSSSRIATHHLPAADMGLSPEAPEFVPSTSSWSVPQPYFYIPVMSSSATVVAPSCYGLSLSHNGAPLTSSRLGTQLPQYPFKGTPIGNLVGANLYQAPSAVPPYIAANGKGASAGPDFVAALQTPTQNGRQTVRTHLPGNMNHESVTASVDKVQSYVKSGTKLLVILRGLPGCGKSHLARAIKEANGGKVFSTDDYFQQNGAYEYKREELSDAHTWNKQRVKESLDQGMTPVIVDNTNVTLWEMLPYAQLADARGYAIEVMEPETPWKFQPKRLAKYNCHSVPVETIKRMKDRYQPVDTATLRVQLDKVKSDSSPPQARPAASPSPKQPCVEGSMSGATKASSKPAAQGTKKSNSAAQISGGGKCSKSPSAVPLKSPGGGKKKSKKQKTHELEVWEYISSLMKGGATDEEVDAFIYMAKLTDGEKEEINQWRASFRLGNGGNVRDGHCSHFNSRKVPPVDGEVKGENDSSRSVFEKHGSEPQVHVKAAAEFSEALQWEEPKPQRKAKKSQFFTEKQYFVKVTSTHLSGQLSSNAEQWQEDQVPQADLTWDNPKPQRKDRGSRTPRGSTSDVISSKADEDSPAGNSTSPEVQNTVSGELHSHSDRQNTGPSTELRETRDNDPDVIVEAETEEILSFVVLGSGSDVDEGSRETKLDTFERRGKSTMGTLKQTEGKMEVERKGMEVVEVKVESQPTTDESLSSIVLLGSSASSGDESLVSSVVITNIVSLQESDNRLSFSPEKVSSTSGADNSTSSPQNSAPRKKVRRKKHKAAPTPFLDDAFKVQLTRDSWTTLSPIVHRTERQMSSGGETEELSCIPFTAGQNASSQTEVQDFNVLFMVEKRSPGTTVPLGECYQYVQARGMYSCTDVAASHLTTTPSMSGKRKLDKSTTMDADLDQREPNMEILQTCFPEVAAGHLQEVLEVCRGNMEWATNLLLDWGISMPFSPNDKHQLQQEMAKHQQHYPVPSAPSTSDNANTSSGSQPSSLFDLCQKQLSLRTKSQNLSDDVQRHLISSGYQRLQRLESHEFERIRSISFDESPTGGLTDDIISLSSFTATSPVSKQDVMSKKGLAVASHSKASGQLKDIAEIFSSGSSRGSSQSGSLDDLHAASTERTEVEDAKSSQKAEMGQPTAGQPDTESMVDSWTLADDAGGLRLTLPRTLITQLEQVFGVLPQRDTDADVSVSLDVTTAFNLYESLAQSLSGSRSTREQERLRQLKEETGRLISHEALAQWLQSEEEVDKTLQSLTSTSTTSYTPPQKLPSHQNIAVGGVRIHDQSKRGAPRASPAPSVNLQEIMDEELERQRRQEMQLKQLEATGHHIAIATKLKREKLIQHFPGIDEDFLEEIFQANEFCLETTVSIIEGALGGKQPVPHKLITPSAASNSHTTNTSMNAEAEEEKRIKTAKQQSLLDMLNSAWKTEKFQRVDTADGGEFDYRELRQEALVHHRMRGDCFQKAHEAYRRGMKEVALFYSQQGRLHAQRMQEANKRASQKILEAREARLNEESTLDLHGLHVDEAIAALKQVVEEKEREFHEKPVHNRRYLHIITGRGKHSQNGPKLRPAVSAHLTATGHRFTEIHPGMLRVNLHPSPAQ